MELVKMYQNKENTLHYEGCLINKWGLVLMVTYDKDRDEEKVRETRPDSSWYNRFFNSEYYHM